MFVAALTGGVLKLLRRNSQVSQARQFRRRHGVNLHELDLVSRDKWAWQERRCARQRGPDGKRDRKQRPVLAISGEARCLDRRTQPGRSRSRAYKSALTRPGRHV